jgi:hypothetical protein
MRTSWFAKLSLFVPSTGIVFTRTVASLARFAMRFDAASQSACRRRHDDSRLGRTKNRSAISLIDAPLARTICTSYCAVRLRRTARLLVGFGLDTLRFLHCQFSFRGKIAARELDPHANAKSRRPRPSAYGQRALHPSRCWRPVDNHAPENFLII